MRRSISSSSSRKGRRRCDVDDVFRQPRGGVTVMNRPVSHCRAHLGLAGGVTLFARSGRNGYTHDSHASRRRGTFGGLPMSAARRYAALLVDSLEPRRLFAAAPLVINGTAGNDVIELSQTATAYVV